MASDEAVRLLQITPQYIEVPPNIEAKQIVSSFTTVLSFQSNPSLLNDDSMIPFISDIWQAICK
jgi:hypothetical protein